MKPTTMKQNHLKKDVIHGLLALAGLVALQQSVACKEGDGDSLESRVDCYEYCRQAQECNGDVNRSECQDDCRDQLGECKANELDAVQEKLDSCAEKSCDEFTACKIDVGAQCYFGI